MNRIGTALILGVAALTLAGAGCSGKKKPGCKKDTDCKGARVCEKGACVSATSKAEDPAQAGKKKPQGLMAALKAAQGQGASPKAGPGGTGPGTPTPAPGGAGTWNKDSIRICLDQRCVGLGRGFGSNTQDMRAMLEMLKQLMFTGFSGKGSGQLPKLKVCVGPQCVNVDKSLLTNPMALIKLFSNIDSQMLRNLFKGTFSRRPGFDPHRGHATPPPPRGAQALRTFAELLKAGDQAIGRTAELARLSITSVSDTRLVLEGPGREMIVLRIPPTLKSLLPRLRITTQQVTVRFRVLSRPIGKLVHGELLGYD
jgi:hypothetical protein